MTVELANDLSPADKLYNVILLGITFMLIFTGYATCGLIEQTVLNSYKKEHEGFRGDGFTSMAIVYTAIAVANWIAPSIISIVGPKYSMVMAGTLYTLYIATIIKPLAITLYICSVLVGIGSAVIWASQGIFLTMNSNETTMGRNSAIFSVVKQCSLVFGNLYVYFAWRGVTTITDHERIPLIIGLTAVTGFGTFCMLFFRSQPRSQTDDRREVSITKTDENTPLLLNKSVPLVNGECQIATSMVYHRNQTTSKATRAWLAFKKSIQLIKTRDMLQLSVFSLYFGVLIAFCNIYITRVGDIAAFGEDSDRLVGLTSIAIGFGEILGAIFVGVQNMYNSKHGRGLSILVGMCVHILSYFLIFLSTPDSVSPEQKTSSDIAYIIPNEDLAVFSSFLLGFGDACINVQIVAIFGLLYSEDSASAFALGNFESAIGAAVALTYGGHLLLKWQILILIIMIVSGALCFFDVDLRLQTRQMQNRAVSNNMN